MDLGPEDDEFEAPLPDAWMEELRWARLGQYRPLIDSLLAGKALPANEERAAREFLAEVLAGKVDPPPGDKPAYSDVTWAVISDGEWDLVKTSYKPLCDAAAFYWQCKREDMDHKTALEKAFNKFGIRTLVRQNQLAQWVRRSTKQRKRLALPATAKPKRT